MNEQFREFRELTTQANHYLESRLFCSPRTMGGYHKAWRQIMEYMLTNGIRHYDREVARQFIDHEFGNRAKRELSKHERYRYNGAWMLAQFKETGHIDAQAMPPPTPIVFDGPLGDTIIRFLDYKREVEGLSVIRLHCYERNLFLFFQYCDQNQIHTIQDIELSMILRYLKGLDGSNKTTVYTALSTLRGFMKYAFKQGLTATDYSVKVPKYKSVHQDKLPSTYSKEEVEQLLKSAERASPTGKRNYAILLLAARLGLRASDISYLKFEHLNWESSTLCIKQVKTGKELILPLLADVGNALIDYLRYGRPQSKEPYVFLTARPPYGPFMTSNVVTHVVQRAFKKSGIAIKDRRFGPHSLRHSLGFSLLEASTVLPIISEVFGHKSTESTRYYLRIDLQSMRQCMLDVPAVPIEFYEQKGGIFYE